MNYEPLPSRKLDGKTLENEKKIGDERTLKALYELKRPVYTGILNKKAIDDDVGGNKDEKES